MGELLLVVLSPLVVFLVAYKADQQIVYILEGALYGKKQNISVAKAAYAKHLPSTSTALLITGFTVTMAVALMWSEDWLSWLAITVGVSLVVVGVFQRMAAFKAAARDLGVG